MIMSGFVVSLFNLLLYVVATGCIIHMLDGPDHIWLARGEYIRSSYGNRISKNVHALVVFCEC